MKRIALPIAAGAALAAVGTIAASRGSLLQRVPASAREIRNPYKGAESARLAGGKLYKRECASCHGDSREGIGHAPPLDSLLVRKAPPGAIYRVLRDGAVFHGMPSFSHLPGEQRWQIVTYLQATGRD